MFHIGHLNLLRRARMECDYLIAGVVTDEVCLAQKGKLPVIPFDERIAIVRSLDVVDAAFGEVTTDKLSTWAQVRFDVVFKGDDWKGSPKWVDLAERFAQVNVLVRFLPYTEHTSSTRLRDILTTLEAAEGGNRNPGS
jgi:glycerol-3-phosphate cytidylyltransferase